MAGAATTGLTGNPAFPAPMVDLKAVPSTAGRPECGFGRAGHGRTAETAEKNDKREALIDLLRKLKQSATVDVKPGAARVLRALPGLRRSKERHTHARIAGERV